MVKIRLRTKFLLSLVLTTAALAGASLLIVQSYAGKHAAQDIREQVNSSLVTFQLFAQQRQRMLSQAAEIAANLPNVKALMTTRHEPTIQDASVNFSGLAGTDLFMLADPTGKVMALHNTGGDIARESAQILLSGTLQLKKPRDWWFAGGRLYEVSLQPIYFGAPQQQVVLGVLAAGFEVDQRLAAEVSRIASSHVAFRYGKTVIVSTLTADQQNDLALRAVATDDTSLHMQEIRLGTENFIGTSVQLAPAGSQPVTLTVLKSYDEATLFLRNLNRLLLAVGLIAVLAGGGLIFLISDTFTRPLGNLVSGVRALEQGDFKYPLNVQSRDELGELTSAFERMRSTLQESQRHLLAAERMATIGRMASSISHDLRHPLTTIMAYAEILSERDVNEDQRRAVHREIVLSVNKMTELIASLLEFSKAQEPLHRVPGDLLETLQRTIVTIRMWPEFRQARITLSHSGSMMGCFDFKKLERAFHNILQNAAEAAAPDSIRIQVTAVRVEDQVEVSVTDNGPGIPDEIRNQIFQPFVTHGKVSGTGIGLAVVRKIVLDHGGDIRIESDSPAGTTFKLILPAGPADSTALADLVSPTAL